MSSGKDGGNKTPMEYWGLRCQMLPQRFIDDLIPQVAAPTTFISMTSRVLWHYGSHNAFRVTTLRLGLPCFL